MLFYLEHAIQDASLTRTGERRVVSKRMLYVELDAAGNARHLQYAPYLDYRPLENGRPFYSAIFNRPECAWITQELEQKAQAHAVAQVVPEHLEEVRGPRLNWIHKTELRLRTASPRRLTIGITEPKSSSFKNRRAKSTRGSTRRRPAGGPTTFRDAFKNVSRSSLGRQISPSPPVVLGGFLILPPVFFNCGSRHAEPGRAIDPQAVAARARAIVMDMERSLGFEPTDQEFEKLGYDIESKKPGTGQLRFVEVKGRAQVQPF